MDVRNLEEKVMVFEGRIAELTDATQTDADEMVALKTTVTSLDKEKDILQGEVDDKAERLAALQQQLTSKVTFIFCHMEEIFPKSVAALQQQLTYNVS